MTIDSFRWIGLILHFGMLAAAAADAPPSPCFPPATPRPPNIIVIVADDVGYRDIGAQGSRDIPTPHIDTIAQNGLRFTSGYVTAPICSPSRAALLTGRYQQRFGHETNPGTSLERDPHFGLPLTEETIGDRFKALDFATGWIGKSHLGGVDRFHPLQRGFDEFFGFIESHHDYFDTGEPLIEQHDPILRGTMPIVETNYLTTAFARECIDFIDRHTNAPFFLYAPFNAIHFPLQYNEHLSNRVASLAISDPRRQRLAGVLMGLDEAVGAILLQLRLLNLESNTVIFFTSDNGGTVQLGSDNGLLRGGKTEVYEGGIRVPFFLQWKGRLAPGQIIEYPVSTLDILPTAVAAAGGSLAAAWQLDGVNLLPYLCGQTNGVPHPRLFWRVETDGLSPGGEVQDGLRAVREGDWKLVKPGVNDTWELYDLGADIGETTNLADARPDIVQQLVSAYEEWNSQLARPLWAVDDVNFETPEFILEDLRIGETGFSYLAPDFLPGSSAAAFQDSTNNVWRGSLDLASGFFRSGHGRDQLVDAGLAPLGRSLNGPLWGVSSNGPTLFYEKADTFDRLQIWRTAALDSIPTTVQLTSNPSNHVFGLSVSQEATQGFVQMAFHAGGLASATAAWSSELAPNDIRPLPRHSGGFRKARWIPGSADVVYSAQPGADPSRTEIARYETATGTVHFLTNDGGEKSDVWGILAPEYGGELCYVAVLNRQALALYRDLRDNPGGFYTRMATLTMPTNLPPRFIYSLEPLPGLRGFNGVSYFTCAAFEQNDPLNPGDAAMWLIGLGPDPEHGIARRLDAGMGRRLPADRRDPKTVIGQNEIFCYYLQTTGTNATQLRLASSGLTRPEYLGPPSGFTTLEVARGFTAGTRDTNGVFMGGTETMHLVAHNGRLYASQGSRGNFPYPVDTNNLPDTWSGAQILVKTSADSPWQVDEAAPPIFRVHLRVEALTDFTFTTDGNGRRLMRPANLLIAGLGDIYPDRPGGQLASARTRQDVAPFAWHDSHVATTVDPADTISFGSHVDRVTGVHHIFAGLSNGEIYRGSYDESADSKLSWVTNRAELSGVGPVTAFAECNGLLYAACGIRQGSPGAVVEGGLFVRRDADRAWQLVHRWPHPVDLASAPDENRLMRGLTTVPEPRGDGREVLLAACSWPGVIERIDPRPAQGHVVTVELDVRDFLARTWNDERMRDGVVTIAYTGFTPVVDPVTGDTVHLAGLGIQHPDPNALAANAAYFLVRHRDATYELAALQDASVSPTSDTPLRATRCIALSPFPSEPPATLYLGGFDTAEQESHDSAWILRGSWSNWPALTLARNDGDWQLTWPAVATNWVLEASPGVGSNANWQRLALRRARSKTRETQAVSPSGPRLFYRLRQP